MKGFTVALQYSPFKKVTDGNLNELHGIMGKGPSYAEPGSAEYKQTVANYKRAKAVLQTASQLPHCGKQMVSAHRHTARRRKCLFSAVGHCHTIVGQSPPPGKKILRPCLRPCIKPLGTTNFHQRSRVIPRGKYETPYDRKPLNIITYRNICI